MHDMSILVIGNLNLLCIFQVMRLMAMPQNAPNAIQAVSYMVDDIWYHAGDTSTDVCRV